MYETRSVCNSVTYVIVMYRMDGCSNTGASRSYHTDTAKRVQNDMFLISLMYNICQPKMVN